MKSIIRTTLLPVMAGLLYSAATAQEIVVTDSTAIQEETEISQAADSLMSVDRIKVDGVAAVVGDYVVLDSDIDKMYIELRSQRASLEGVTPCNLLGRLLENKLYAHHAIQDSIIVSEAEISASVDQQIGYMVQQVGSMEKVLEFYKKDSEVDFRSELYNINKENMLASQMQRSIVDAVEITPEEVREFFNNIPEDARPMFGDEVEISQIVIKPEIPESEKEEAIRRLNEMRTDVLENGASFSTKAVLYSDDSGTKSTGGKISMSRNDPFVKEFKEVGFSLQEGEVSKPFETQYGYHILTVDKIRGQTIDVRHILIIPEVTDETVEAAKKEVDSLQQLLANKEIGFAEAARKFSDEEETRTSGGQLINPATGDARFELTKVPPLLYSQVQELEEGEISTVITDQDDTGRPFYTIFTLTKRIPSHIADYAQDFNKIKELALRDKQLKVIEEWQEEKIEETYVKVNGKFRDCEFASNWLKQ